VPEVALAHDGGDTPALGIVDVQDGFYPTGSSDDPFNGFRVFLSSPRHADSGSRGECTDPGYQENVNGRQWNWRAANGDWYSELYDPTLHNRNLHGRGYYVRVSPNTKDNGYLDNIEMSKNFGANLHIVTHTNAASGCESSANYLLVMWKQDADAYDDKDLATALKNNIEDYAPGGQVLQQRTNLAELDRNAPRGDAYVELVFHDHQAAQRWIHDKTPNNQFTYGLSVDQYLDYPS